MDDSATREAEQAVPATRKRKRSRAGCTGCRDFKKKCDEQQPCSRCATAGRPCVYPPPRKGNIMRNKAPPSPQNAAPMVRLAVAAPPQSTPLDCVPSTNRSAPINSSTSPSSISRGSHHPHMSVTCAGPDTDDVELSENPIPCPLSEDFSGDLLQWISELTAPGRKTPSGTVVRSPDTASQALDSQESQQSLLESLIFDTGSTPSSFGQMPTETPLSQSNDVLGIPYDCEPSIWKDFAESSLWHGQPQEDSTARMHTSLMEYFKNFVAPTIVICRDTSLTDSGSFLSLYGASETIYQPLAELVAQNNSNVLKQAILHLSAVHVSNFLFAFGNPDRAILFSTEAEKRRSMTLKALRVSAAQEDKDACVATSPVIMLLLTLSAFLRGDIDIVPTYLQQCSIYLARLADTFTTVNSMTSSYIAMEALFTIYSVFHALAQDRQKDLGTLFAAWTKTRSHPTWRRQWNGISESIIGISMDMLILLVQVQNLSYEHAVIVTALKRLPDDIELQLMALETKSNAQSLYGRLENHHIWESQFQKNFSERIKLGHEIYRLAARVCILSNIITDSPPARIAGTVAELVRLCTKIPPGSEIGCCWPWVVIASESEEAQREKVLPFIRRCQWKGSANPRLAEKVVKEVWRRRDGAEEGASWRNVLAEMGSPVLL